MQVSVSCEQHITDGKISTKGSDRECKTSQQKTFTYLKATTCVARIADPLWKKVCNDLIYNMGPAFVFNIWDSTLGEISSQDKVLHLTCPHETAAAFIQQYDFVILDSLQSYFPGLKSVRAEVVGI